MATEILMPVLAAGMEEATLVRWLKAEGDAIAVGDVIAEVETDKATLEMEAEAAGVLGRILVGDGSAGVPVNSPIALLLADGENVDTLPGAVSAAVPEPAPAPGAAAEERAPAAAPPSGPEAGQGRRVLASPLARRLAALEGIDLGSLTGSGPRGRIVRLDVDRAVAQGAVAQGAVSSAPVPAAAPAPAPAPAVSVAVQAAQPAQPAPMPWQSVTAYPNSGMRKTIARRLQESKQTMPHFYLTVDVMLDALLALRADLNGRSGVSYKLSVNDFIIKAAALALRQVPEANAMWTDEAILRFETVDISVAVATDGGLITPVVRQADTKGLATLSGEVKALAAKARDGKLAPEEYQGGGFTISNLGMYGIREFSAILNPPQSCILAVGAAEQRPVVRDGALAVATVMTCTLSVDHRAVDGAVGASFLAAFKPFLEDPLRLML